MSSRPPVVAGLTLVRMVGRGGEGEVWEARSTAGERRALKLVRPEAVASPAQVAMRGDWLRRIFHPALVRVRRTALLSDAGLTGWGLVEMDFVEGNNLADARARGGAIESLEPLADGLDRLHDGVWSDGTPLVHRDVKPANLIAGPDGRVVLVDCSSLCGVDRTLLTRIGTPLFAAPEVITGRIGPPADVYSFAATVIALMTGARGEELLRCLDHPWSLDVPDLLRAGLDPDPARRPRHCAVMLAPQRLHLDPTWLPAVSGLATAISTSIPDVSVQPSDWSPMALGSVRPPTPLPGSRVPQSGVSQSPVAQSEFLQPPGAQSSVRPSPLAPAGVPTVPAPPPRSVWPFLVLLTGVGALLAGAAIEPQGLGRTWIMAALALSVVAHLAAGRRPLAALLIPTVSWSFLLAARASTDEGRRAWIRATVSAILTAAWLLAWLALQQPGVDAGLEFLVVTIAAACVLTSAAVAAARSTDSSTLWVRIALAPLTLAGAALLVAGAVIAAPVALLRNSIGGPRWLVAQALRACGAIALFGRPARRRPGVDDDRDAGFLDHPHATFLEDDWSAA